MFSFWRKEEFGKLNRWIGIQIKTARDDRNMTQEELAKKTHKSRVNISNVERGEVAIAADDLALIAYALDKAITSFFPVTVRGATAGDLSEDEKDLIHFYRQIQNPAMEKYAIKQVRDLANAALEANIQTRLQDLQDNVT